MCLEDCFVLPRMPCVAMLKGQSNSLALPHLLVPVVQHILTAMPPKNVTPAPAPKPTFEWNKLREVTAPGGDIINSNEKVRHAVNGHILTDWDLDQLLHGVKAHEIMEMGTIEKANARIDCQQDVNDNNPYWNIQVQWGGGTLACLVLPAGLKNAQNKIKGLLVNLVDGIALPNGATKHTARYVYDPTL